MSSASPSQGEPPAASQRHSDPVAATAPRAPGAADSLALDRHALRRLGRVWLTVAAVEAVLYLLLYRSPELRGLYELPAVAIGVAGLFESWRESRRHTRDDRRHSDRRRDPG